MKTVKRILAVMTVVSLFVTGTSAYAPVPVHRDGEPLAMNAKLVDGTTYVPFEAANIIFSGENAVITGNANVMYAKSPAVTVSASAGACYIEASGRFFGGSNALVIDGELHIPIRAAAKAYDIGVDWLPASRSVELTNKGGTILSGDKFYAEDEVYWLARIIHAEAQGEPLDGKILVGNVILNRVASPDFPNTIYNVIFDRKYGVQFSPILNGTIYNVPNEDSVIAAKLCLEGYSLSKNALYFLNPRIATNFWIPSNRPYLTSIGSHDFYA